MRKRELKIMVKKSIQTYNKYRSPEAVAQLLEMNEDKIKIKLSGTYCETCGLYDWIEDFKYVLEDHGIKADIDKIIEPEDYYGDRIIVFKIKSTLKK